MRCEGNGGRLVTSRPFRCGPRGSLYRALHGAQQAVLINAMTAGAGAGMWLHLRAPHAQQAPQHRDRKPNNAQPRERLVTQQSIATRASAITPHWAATTRPASAQSPPQRACGMKQRNFSRPANAGRDTAGPGVVGSDCIARDDDLVFWRSSLSGAPQPTTVSSGRSAETGRRA